MNEPIPIRLSQPIYREDCHGPSAIVPRGSRCRVERRPTDRVFRVPFADGPKPKEWPELTRWLKRLENDER